MRPSLFALTALAFLAVCGGDQVMQAGTARPEISTGDVRRFVDAYRKLDPADTNCAPLGDYLRQESKGLAAYRDKFEVTQADICRMVRGYPRMYSHLEAKLPALDSVAGQTAMLFERFRAMYPAAKMPGVYLVVGNGIAGGTTTRGRDPIIMIGMELNKSTDGLAAMLAHEMVHTQQRYPLLSSANGGPKFIRGPMVRHAIAEGSANFIAELLTGIPHRNAYGEANEARLWKDFQRDMSARDYRLWLYNGRDSVGREGRPADLGYWMGYRIAKSYYDHASDKSKAVADMLTIRDFKRFVRESRYSGGQ
jgi:hypothetical protein